MEKRKNDYRQHIVLQVIEGLYNAILAPIFYVGVILGITLLSFLGMSLLMRIFFG